MYDDLIMTKRPLVGEEYNRVSKELHQGCYELLIEHLGEDKKIIQNLLEGYINSILEDYDTKFIIEFDIEKYKINIIFK